MMADICPCKFSMFCPEHKICDEISTIYVNGSTCIGKTLFINNVLSNFYKIPVNLYTTGLKDATKINSCFCIRLTEDKNIYSYLYNTEINKISNIVPHQSADTFCKWYSDVSTNSALIRNEILFVHIPISNDDKECSDIGNINIVDTIGHHILHTDNTDNKFTVFKNCTYLKLSKYLDNNINIKDDNIVNIITHGDLLNSMYQADKNLENMHETYSSLFNNKIIIISNKEKDVKLNICNKEHIVHSTIDKKLIYTLLTYLKRNPKTETGKLSVSDFDNVDKLYKKLYNINDKKLYERVVNLLKYDFQTFHELDEELSRISIVCMHGSKLDNARKKSVIRQYETLLKDSKIIHKKLCEGSELLFSVCENKDYPAPVGVSVYKDIIKTIPLYIKNRNMENITMFLN